MLMFKLQVKMTRFPVQRKQLPPNPDLDPNPDPDPDPKSDPNRFQT